MKQIRKWMPACILMTLMLSLTSCQGLIDAIFGDPGSGGTSDNTPVRKMTTSIWIDRQDMYLVLGLDAATRSLTTTSDGAITVAVSDPEKATASYQDGMLSVTPKAKTGETTPITITISVAETATCQGASAALKVYIYDVDDYIKLVESIEINDEDLELKKGETYTMKAPTIAPESDVTDKGYVWSSSDEAIATIDENGLVTAVAPGTAKITVTANNFELKNVSDEITVTVTPKDRKTTKLTLDTQDLYLNAKGKAATLEMATNSDGTITATSSDDTKATATYDKNNGMLTVTPKADTGTDTPITITIEVAQTEDFEAVTAKIKVYVLSSVDIKDVTSITLSKTTLELKKGETAALTATIVPADATDQTYSWSSSDEKVATVATDGTVTALKSGKATITCTAKNINNPVTATCAVTVTTPVEGIECLRGSVTMEIGGTAMMLATLTPADADDKRLQWESDNTSVVTVDQKGIITAVGGGEATITVVSLADKTIKDDISVTVTEFKEVTNITLSNNTLALKKGETAALTATIVPADATDQTYSWSSSNGNVATIASNGTVTALKSGEAIITCTAYNNDNPVTATCSITVTTPIQSIECQRGSITMEKGGTAKMMATVIPDDADDKRLHWESDNTSVVTVDQDGNIKAVGGGQATITVVSLADESIKDYISVTVTRVPESISMRKTLVLQEGQSSPVMATVLPNDCTDKGLSWTSSNTAVATVDQNGNVTAVAAGEATITATSTVANYSDVTASCNVVVQAAYVPVESVTLGATTNRLLIGESFTFSASISPSNSSDKLIDWSSSDPKVVSIDQNGKATAIASGTATITAMATNGVKATCQVTVPAQVGAPNNYGAGGNPFNKK